MGFLDTVDDNANGGELQERIYLDKKQPTDMMVQLIDYGIGTRDDDHPSYPGEQFFAVELECVEKFRGQADIVSGTTFSYFIDMREGMGKQRRQFAVREIATFLASVTERPKNEFLEDGKIKERILESCENAVDYNGDVFRLDATEGNVSAKSGTTFYNPVFQPTDNDDE